MDHRIDLLKSQDQKAISEIYKEYRHGFLLFAKRYDLKDSQVLDIYQDSIIALYENAQKGHIDNLSVSLKTYLFSIGKYMIYKALKQDAKKIKYDDLENIIIEWEDFSEDAQNEDLKDLRLSFSELGEKCQQILKLFYYDEKNLDDITTIMAYDNKNVAKSQKSRCLKKLKHIMQKRNG